MGLTGGTGVGQETSLLANREGVQLRKEREPEICWLSGQEGGLVAAGVGGSWNRTDIAFGPMGPA